MKLVDGLVRYRFEDNGDVMGAWISAKNRFGPRRQQRRDRAGRVMLSEVVEVGGGQGPAGRRGWLPPASWALRGHRRTTL